MAIYANIIPGLSRSASRCLSLILCWVSGLFSGYCFGNLFSVSLTRSALYTPVSVVGLFVCVFLPLFLTYLSVITDKPIIILIVCFIKAVAYGFCGMLIFRIYNTASWIIQVLFQFSDSCYCIVLLYLWFRRLCVDNIDTMRDIVVCAFIGMFVAAADLFVINAILVGII